MAKTHVDILEVTQVSSLPNLRSSRGGFGFEGSVPKYWDGTSWSTFSGAGSGVSTWDEMYDNDKALTMDAASLTFTLTHATNDGLTLAAQAGKTGAVLAFNNAGDGRDIDGSGDTWHITKAGVITATALTMGDDELITLGDGQDATISWNASLLDITGVTEFANNVSFAANATITQGGTAGSTVFTLTAGDAILSDGSLAITDADNAATFSVTNATATTGNVVVVTADAATTGSILYIDNGGASLTSGYYINCNDDGTSDFTVAADGATTITTATNSTAALSVTGVQTSQSMVTFDNTGGVIASDEAVLLLDAGGAVASGGNLLRVAPTGSPNAGAIGVEFVGAGKALTALYIDADPTGSDVATIHGGGALTSDNAVLTVSSDGALATGSNTFRVDTAGTPASGAIYAEFDFAGITDTNENIGFKIDAGGKKVNALHIDADPVAGDVAYIHSDAVIADNKAVLQVHSAGAVASGGSVFRVEVDGTPASGAIYSEFDFTGITDTNENIGFKIDAGGKKVVGLHVDADPVAGSAVYFTSGAALAADKATLEVVAVPTTNNADSSVLRLEQTHTAGAGFIVTLVQKDVSEPFINFESTAGDGNSVDETNGTQGAVTAIVRCAFNGTDAYITLRAAPSA